MNQNDDTKIKSLKSAAKQLKNQVFDNGEGSTISVITYSSSANFKDTYSDNTRDSRDFDRMIDNLWGNGGTDIYEALDETISVVNNRLKVNEETKNNETIVVFLTDGSPTIPDYISGVHSDDNTGDNWTYSNNTKSEIEQKAEELKATGVKEVYSIGLDLDGLSETNVRSASKCEIVKIDTNSVYDMNTHTFTITLTNPTDSSVTLDNVTAEFSDIEELVSVDNNGSILGYDNTTATWNVTIGARETITLTGSYEPEYGYRNTGRPWDPNWETYEKNPSISVDTGYEGVCVSEEHNEMFNGKPLYSVIKTTRNGDQYHGITEKDYANYLLSKISTEGKPMLVNEVSVAFDEILQGLTTEYETYTLEEGSVLDIPETRTITADVTVKIGDSANTYSLNQLRRGVDGLKYVDGKGFEWTITGETLLTSELSLEYKVSE